MSKVHRLRRFRAARTLLLLNTTAYWVTLSKLVEDVKKKKAELDIEIFEGTLEMVRKGEIDELPSGSESKGKEEEL